MSILRKVRGVLGTALFWSAAWAPLGAVWAVVFWGDAQLRAHQQTIPLPPVGGLVVMCAAWGFIAGTLFATGLAIMERRGASLRALIPSRLGALGALGGAALPLWFHGAGTPGFFPQVVLVLMSAGYGGSIAVGMLKLVQRDVRALPPEGRDGIAFPTNT